MRKFKYSQGFITYYTVGNRYICISPFGSCRWYLNGNRHREDGPAVIRYDGTKEWWVHGKRHREDGPAFMGIDGSTEWWINGEYITNPPKSKSPIPMKVKRKITGG